LDKSHAEAEKVPEEGGTTPSWWMTLSSAEGILRTVKAMEGFVQMSAIAMGILQMTSLKFSRSIRENIRYMRTPSKGSISEATLMAYFRRHIFRIGRKAGFINNTNN